MTVTSSEYWKYRPRLRRVRNIAVLMVLCGGAAFGIESCESWAFAPAPPMTTQEAWQDGYADALSVAGSVGGDQPPFGKYTCVTDWNAQVAGGVWMANGTVEAEFTNGGPPATRDITYADQDTGTRLGNAWMAGCRAGLVTLGPGF